MKYLYIFLTLIFFSSQLAAIDRQAAEPDSASWEPVIDTTFSPSVSIAFGLTNRIDQTSIIDHKPTIHLKVYSELTKVLSLKVGFGYNHNTKFKTKNGYPAALIRNYFLETGIRWSFYKNLNSFFVENGFEYNTYNDPIHDEFEQRIGLNVTIGFNIHLLSAYYLDLAVGHTVNNIDFGESEFYPENSNDQVTQIVYNGHVIGLRDSDFYEELYTPTFYRMLIFIKL